MVDSDQIKQSVLMAAEQVGRSTLIEFLVMSGVSVSTSSKLVAGKYDATIGDTVGRKVKKALVQAAKKFAQESA